jgi:hypothetical protein
MLRKPHVYQWDDEPADERPSEFASTSGYTSRSGYHPAMDPAPRRTVRFGARSVLFVTLLLLGAGGWILHRFAHLLGR